MIINGGAQAATSPTLKLTLSANDVQPAVASMRLSTDGTNWEEWQPYAGTISYNLAGSNGLKTLNAEFRDVAGNVSTPVSDTIRLDTEAGTQRLVSINTGALWTNAVAVTLTVGAPGTTTQMQISNDGGFGGAVWQPFDTRPDWTISSFGNYTLS